MQTCVDCDAPLLGVATRCRDCRTEVDESPGWRDPRGKHDPANVRLAHLGCNSVRGNRGGGEQLLLVG